MGLLGSNRPALEKVGSGDAVGGRAVNLRDPDDANGIIALPE